MLSSLVRDGFAAQLRALPAVVRGIDEGAKARAFDVLTSQMALNTLWPKVNRFGVVFGSNSGSLAFGNLNHAGV